MIGSFYPVLAQVVSVKYKEDRPTFVQSSHALRKSLPDPLITWDRDGAIGKPYGADNGIPIMVMLHRGARPSAMAKTCWMAVAEINALLSEPSPTSTATAAN